MTALAAAPGARRLLLLAAALAAVLLAAVLLAPVTAPRAAGADDASGNAAPAGTSFGSATPSDKYVQAFQQQVSQQLQSALAQANDTQESRLRGFEQQQRQLEDQLRAVEQSLAGGNAAGAAASAALPDIEAPHVYARQAKAPEAASDSASDPLAGLLPGPLGTQSAESGAALAAAPAPYDERMGNLAATARSPRPRDANIAPHGFIDGRLLNGVVAVLGGPDRESIVALSGNYQSANGFVSNLDGCLALVQGKPEIAAGRIDFKLSRLTCNFANGASRTWDASGWLVDADGIRGLRAVIVDNSARKAAVAAAGGAVGGLGQRLSQQQYQVSAGPVALGSSSTFTGSPARDALGGAGTGAANALGQSIADYYNLYTPSLQVGGGTPVTVVLANDLRLPPAGRDISQTHTATP